MDQYEGIVEVVRGPYRVANHYLGHKYRLLAIMSSTSARKKPDGQYYVHRGVEYVLGRTAETPRAPMVPGRQARAQGDAEPTEVSQGDAEPTEVSQSASE